MKKNSVMVAIGVVGLSIGLMTQTGSVEGATKDSLIEQQQTLRVERIQAKLALIHQKAGEEVKNKVAEKIKIKEAKIAEQIKAKETVIAAQQAAEQAQVQAAEQAQVEQAPQQAEAQADWSDGVDATSGASQSGREIGQRNQEYGQQLSDPNLSQDQRQQIIQEKKNYNSSRR